MSDKHHIGNSNQKGRAYFGWASGLNGYVGALSAGTSGTLDTVGRTYSKSGISIFLLTGGTFVLSTFQDSLQLSRVFMDSGTGWSAYLAVLAVLLLSSFVSGLSGFGFSAMGAALMLMMKPASAVALLLMLSMFTQLISLKKLWGDLKGHVTLDRSANSLTPYILGGVMATPVGVMFLNHADPRLLMGVLGGILVLYAAYSLLKPKHWILVMQPGWVKSVLVGAAGGMVGGFSAFPGSAVVIWTGLQSMPKEQARAITQPYIIAMQAVSIVTFMLHYPHVFDTPLAAMVLLALPIVYIGNSAGVRQFKAMEQALFRKVTFGLLGVSGAVIVIKALLS